MTRYRTIATSIPAGRVWTVGHWVFSSREQAERFCEAWNVFRRDAR